MKTRTYPNSVREFAALANAVNRSFNRMGQPYDYASNGGTNGEAKMSLPVDIWSTNEAFHIAAYLPGMDPESVDITFSDDKLTISGSLPGVAGSEHEASSDEDSDGLGDENSGDENSSVETVEVTNDVKFVRRELFHGSFERTLSFNVEVNADDISATFKHGVLTLDVPKAEEILPKQIKIQVA